MNIKLTLLYLFDPQVNVGENLDKIVDEWTHAEFLMYQYPETYINRMVDINIKSCKTQVHKFLFR